ncbi:MAG: ABC transporter ATP-binding protein [Chloroflexi bacterium]|nr:ABC transporter ATP-binding protein [Chloroflexota bacterium]
MTQSASLAPAIKVEGLTKSFGSYTALKKIDLDVGQQESVVIFGPNGAGKTTLIKVLATILNPTSGKVSINGLDIKHDAEEARRQIGVVSHQTFLYGNLTIHENLDFYGRMYDVPARAARIRQVVETVGMTHRLHHRVNTLSRGMQQRVSIARALLHQPNIILLDEPETGLDQQAISMLWSVLRTGDQVKRTIIHATHNLERGFDLCDRLLIIDRGRIAYERSRDCSNLDELKEAYRHYTGAEAWDTGKKL